MQLGQEEMSCGFVVFGGGGVGGGGDYVYVCDFAPHTTIFMGWRNSSYIIMHIFWGSTSYQSLIYFPRREEENDHNLYSCFI